MIPFLAPALKFLGGNKLMVGLAIAIGVLLLTVAATSKAYLAKRDELQQQMAQTAIAQATVGKLRKEMDRQQVIMRAAEQARIDLAGEVEALRAKGQEVKTIIQTKWRDRVVKEAYPVAVECSTVELPPSVISVLKCSTNPNGSGCPLSEDPSGSSNEMPNS